MAGHSHFSISPPAGSAPKCPHCGGLVMEVAFCTLSDTCLVVPCEHELSITEFEELVGPPEFPGAHPAHID